MRLQLVDELQPTLELGYGSAPERDRPAYATHGVAIDVDIVAKDTQATPTPRFPNN
jgi:hypothetical protein